MQRALVHELKKHQIEAQAAAKDRLQKQDAAHQNAILQQETERLQLQMHDLQVDLQKEAGDKAQVDTLESSLNPR